ADRGLDLGGELVAVGVVGQLDLDLLGRVQHADADDHGHSSPLWSDPGWLGAGRSGVIVFGLSCHLPHRGVRRTSVSDHTQTATTRIEVHWLPVRPKWRTSSRRKSSTMRMAPYQAPNNVMRNPSYRSGRRSQSSAASNTIDETKSYNAVWCTTTPGVCTMTPCTDRPHGDAVATDSAGQRYPRK